MPTRLSKRTGNSDTYITCRTDHKQEFIYKGSFSTVTRLLLIFSLLMPKTRTFYSPRRSGGLFRESIQKKKAVVFPQLFLLPTYSSEEVSSVFSSAGASSRSARIERLTRCLSKSMSVIFALTTSPTFRTSCGFSIR